MLEIVLLSTILLSDTVTTEKVQNLDEVVIVSEAGRGRKRSVKGQVASIDEHLSELRNVSLVRRGSYAWEPVVNNMQTERLSTTIDGMKIFYACTDKMDPVTSYVESGNLQSISLNSGLDGNPQATGNIGGSLDLKLRKAGFDNDAFHASASAGHEWNGHVQVYGADAALSSHRTYLNAGAFYRHADNYKVGGGDELQFSQFQKVNVFANAGLRLAEKDMLEGTLIFDRATDVGYPALNMDVAKAEGLITSLAYKHLFRKASWETKAYYNHITHEMDDTKRPDVQIHMDMPGESWTMGLYSLVRATKGCHELTANYDLYYNRLFADMTMYPGGAAPMYMVTWPDVGTLNTGAALADNIRLSSTSRLNLSGKFSWQNQRLNNDEGYKALSVFFPGMKREYYQTTGRIAANYQLSIENSQFSIGAGWGSRAPTVTEAYGYYLNNTFDQYDYIGNPRLKNESAVELNANYQLSIVNYQLSLDANAFFFSNYIIGQFEPRLSVMTVGAEGVKVYGNISHARIINTSLTSKWDILPWLTWNTRLGYSTGTDDKDDALPLISPFSYTTSLNLHRGRFQGKAELQGNARQTNYGKKYGETQTPAWAIVNLSANYQFSILNSQLPVSLRAGIENLFDKRYTTYSDWCDIPQKGRNVYINLSLEL
jgi:iron complex outermembrane receptor protein